MSDSEEHNGFRISARTVLELGSELISSDIIAFYELIKNGFDAKSKTGVEIRYNVPFRRNAFLRLKSLAKDGQSLESLKSYLKKSIDPASEEQSRLGFEDVLQASDISMFLKSLVDTYRKSNTITISDTGSGMSMDELRDNYLTIGTPNRKREIDGFFDNLDNLNDDMSPPYLGEKGIGRLSAMRLGERLHLETARRTDSHTNILYIDWRRFNDLSAMVEDIDITPVKGAKKKLPKVSGTTLTISDLSEDWVKKSVEELAEYDFARLIDPFMDSKKRPRIALFWNGDRIAIPWLDRSLLDHAHASMNVKYVISDDGPLLKYRLEAGDLGYGNPREVDEGSVSIDDLVGTVIGKDDKLPLDALVSVGPFEMSAHWYNRRRLGGIEGIGDQARVRELQRKWSGIMLFRDNFRVFPYGDDEDDWLGLDRKALGSSKYLLNKAQFVGGVRIGRLRNPQFLDQTNREGLRATPEQQAFLRILQYAIQGLLRDFIKEMERRYKRQPLDLSNTKAEVKNLEARAAVALKQIRKHVPKEYKGIYADLQQAFFEFKDLTERAQKRIAEVEEDGRQMTQMAGVGLMVEVVAHELARASEIALKTLEALRNADLPDNVRAQFDTLKAEMKSVSKRLRVLDPLSVSGRQRTEAFDLIGLINDLVEGHESQFKRHGIALNISTPDKPLRIRAVKGMIVQIFENLISNSIYWMEIKSKRESNYEPRIDIVLEADPLIVYFTDNGSGIALENAEKVFRPFWSLKEKNKRRGIGLFIARECAEHHNGTLVLNQFRISKNKRLNTFILELPESVRL